MMKVFRPWGFMSSVKRNWSFLFFVLLFFVSESSRLHATVSLNESVVFSSSIFCIDQHKTRWEDRQRKEEQERKQRDDVLTEEIWKTFSLSLFSTQTRRKLPCSHTVLQRSMEFPEDRLTYGSAPSCCRSKARLFSFSARMYSVNPGKTKLGKFDRKNVIVTQSVKKRWTPPKM